mgnify:FL=1
MIRIHEKCGTKKDTITFRLRVQDSYAEGHIRTLLKTSLPTRED